MIRFCLTATAAALVVAHPSTITAQTAEIVTKGEVIPISAKSEEGYVIGRLSAGAIIYLQYVEGKWKGWGVLPTDCPDNPKAEGKDRSRVAIASVLPSGKQDVLAVVRPETQRKPFHYVVRKDAEKIVLRMNDNDGDFANNPDGGVKYRIFIQPPPSAGVSTLTPKVPSQPQQPLLTKPSVAGPVATGLSPVQLVEVKPITKKMNITGGAGNATSFQESRALAITIRNGSLQPMSRVVVRWGVVIANLSKNLSTAYGEDEIVDLKPTETKTIETAVITAGGSRSNSRNNAGEKVIGHGVQVLVVGRVVAEEFIPPSVKPIFNNLKPIEAQRQP